MILWQDVWLHDLWLGCEATHFLRQCLLGSKQKTVLVFFWVLNFYSTSPTFQIIIVSTIPLDSSLGWFQTRIMDRRRKNRICQLQSQPGRLFIWRKSLQSTGINFRKHSRHRRHRRLEVCCSKSQKGIRLSDHLPSTEDHLPRRGQENPELQNEGQAWEHSDGLEQGSQAARRRKEPHQQQSSLLSCRQLALRRVHLLQWSWWLRWRNWTVFRLPSSSSYISDWLVGEGAEV